MSVFINGGQSVLVIGQKSVGEGVKYPPPDWLGAHLRPSLPWQTFKTSRSEEAITSHRQQSQRSRVGLTATATASLTIIRNLSDRIFFIFWGGNKNFWQRRRLQFDW